MVAAPVWKTSYRLVLPKEGGRARLQGWGVVENLTGSDWKDVELSLVSGNPVALKQALYSAFYVDRPEIPVLASLRVLPKRDDFDDRRTIHDGWNPDGRKLAWRGVAGKQPAKPRKEKPKDYASADEPTLGDFAPAVTEVPAEPAQTAATEVAATQVLYRFPAKISLASGFSIMVPYVDHELSATRTFLYQPDTNARRPLAALKLKNDGKSALPPPASSPPSRREAMAPPISRATRKCR